MVEADGRLRLNFGEETVVVPKGLQTVVRLTSGVMTTHYMALEAMNTENNVFITYNLGAWERSDRNVVGRTLNITVKA
ncbi:hypothetical protein GCM10027299_54650 [Larkinella ripae]